MIRSHGWTRSLPLAVLTRSKNDFGLLTLINMQADVVEGYRLSPQQERIWSLRNGSSPDPYRAEAKILIEGELDVAELAAAIEIVIERNEILRTTFRQLPSMVMPLQVVKSSSPFSLMAHDLSAFSAAEEAAKLQALMTSLGSFELHHGSPLRIAIVELSSHRKMLLISVTSLCADAKTLTILVNEIVSCYRERSTGSEVTSQRVQYADLAEWLNTVPALEAARVGRDYFRELKIADLLDLQLPFESAPKTAAGFEPRYISFESPVSANRLEAVAKTSGGSPFDLLLACWQILLWRLTGDKEIVVGVAFDGRIDGELVQALGPLTRYLPVHTHLDGDLTLPSVLTTIAKSNEENYKWQVCFDWQYLLAKNEQAEKAMFPVVFEFDEQSEPESLPGLSFTIVEQNACCDKFKIKLCCARRGEHLGFELHYDPALLKGDDVKRLGQSFQTLLSDVLRDPQQPIGNLAVQSEVERKRLLVTLNDNRRDYGRSQCIPLLFERQVNSTPNNIAAVSGEQQLSYADLNAGANQIGRYLQKLGVGREEVVGICMPRTPELVMALLGTMKAGAAYLPLEPGYPAERLGYMIADAGVKVLLTAGDLLSEVPRGAERRISLEQEWKEISQESSADLGVEIEPEQVAYVIYTSGSTGRPKGVMITHGNLVNYISWAGERYLSAAGVERPDFALYTSLAFDLTVTSLFLPLVNGLRLVLYEGEDGVETLRGIVGSAGEWILKATPSHLGMLGGGAYERSRVRKLIVGGEALRTKLAATMQESFGAATEIINEYGPTEATVGCMHYGYVGAEGRAEVSIGRGISNVQVYVLDERQELVGEQVRGELYIGGAGVGRGYLGRAELTAERFIPDEYSGEAGARLYRTGDMARYLADGNIEYLGRVDEQVKLRGYRIELGEIETALRQHEMVQAAVVVIKESPKESIGGDQRLVAYVVSAAELSVSELRRHLVAQLPEYMIPAMWVSLAELPLTPNGKVDRRALQQLEVGAGARREYVGPRTPTEEILSGIWAEVLGVERVGVDDNFFELGGHSLLATQVISRVREAFGIELRLRSLFEQANVRGLAALVETALRGGEATRSERIGRVSREEPLPLSYAQQRLWFLDQLEPGNPFYNIPLAVRLRGELQPEALEQSLNEVVRRHEVLRTSFVVVDGEPRQVVQAAVSLPLPVLDYSELNEREREKEAARVAGEEREGAFDLGGGPLLRVRLLRYSSVEHVLLITLHHIVFDGWSDAVLIRELTTIYAALVKKEEWSLPAPALQYGDYAVWQREWLQGKVLAEHLQYWRDHLLGVPEVLELPADKARPEAPAYWGARWNFELGRELAAHVHDMCRRESVTPFMVLLAAFHVLLARYSGQEDMLIGIPIANRTRVELEALLGFFVNTLPVRLRLARGETVRELWARVKGATLGAYAHQDLPFERLVEELRPERSLSRQALVQVLFIFQNLPGAPDLELPGLKLEDAAVRNDPAVRTDLDLYVNETSDGLSGVFVYSPELFHEATIGLMAQRLTRILEEMVSEPDKPVAELLAPVETTVELLPVAGGEDAPLTYHQERLWFIEEFERGNVYAGSPSYHNLPLLLVVRGAVDIKKLEASLETIIKRHEVIRSRFVETGGKVRQRVAPAAPFRLKVIGPEASLEAARARALADSAAPFSLERDVLLRATLYQVKAGEAVLALTLHHIIADKESLRILLSELQEVYAAEVENRDPQLPVLTAQYGDYARAQRALTEADFEPLLFYWKWQLRGRLRALELPESRPRPAVHTYTAQWEKFSLAEPLAARLKQRCENSGTDMFTLTLAAFKALLHRYARQDEIVVGSVAGQRRQAAFAPLIGPFANLLVLRSDLGRNPSFAVLCEQLQNTVAEARCGQDLPFDKLVHELNPEKDMSRTALFDVLFEYEEQSWAPFSLGTASCAVVETNMGYGKYDLHVSLQESGAVVQGTMVYNGDIYEGFLIRQMLRHFQVLLECVAETPEERIDDVVLLNRAEQQQQLQEWNATDAEWPVDQTLAELFQQQVRATPEKTALVLGAERLTYRELDARANQLAHQLQTLGVTADTLVAICLERSLEMVVALLGVLKAGGAYLPLDPEYPPEHLRFVLEDSGAAYAITMAEFMERLGAPALTTIQLDEDGEALAQQPATAPSSTVGPHNLAYCLYTSGSTGRPKGVLVEQRNVTRLIVNEKLPFVLQADEVWTMFHSYCFDFSVWEMYGALLHGGTLVLVPRAVTKDPALFLELLVAERVTILNQTPSAFYRLAAAAQQRGVSDLTLRYVVFGGEALRPALLAEWSRLQPETKLVNMYGITETTVHVTYKALGTAEIAADASNIGRPIPTMTTYIMDEKQRLLPVGVPGEIVVGGAGVSRGYLNRESLTREKFVRNPYWPSELLYRSGDVGKLLPDGELAYLGRSDDQVQIRGFRVEPGEVQSRLLAHAHVRKAEVVPRTDNDGVTELVAYVVVVPESEVSVSELRRHLAAALPPYMVPSAFVFLAELPVTANGKVDRQQLPAPNQERPELVAALVEATTPIEETLAHIWAAVLRLQRVGVCDDFFELGGHSLLAAQVIARVRDELGVEVPLRMLFEQPTVRGLAEAVTAALRGGLKVTMPPLTRTSREVPLPLSYAQQRLWFLDQLEPGNPFYNVPLAVRLRGELQPEALEQSLNEIIRRHEVLRTSFENKGGRAVQVIAAELRLRWGWTDLVGLSEEEQAEALAAVSGAEATAPFDLSRGPLLRARLLRLGEKEHVALLTLHHIVSDGWSLGVLVREVTRLYESYTSGSAAGLPELEIQYGDYAVWQREWLAGGVLEEQLDYWREQLRGAPAVLELPTDRARPAVQSYCGGREELQLSAELSAALRELSRREGVTLFMTLLAAFQTLLYRYTGQRDIVVGSPIAGRTRVETEDLIGFFVNTLALRSKVDGKARFVDLLRQVREVTLGAHAHQDLPFERLVEELAPERALGHAPLFQVLFVLQNAPQEQLELPGLSLTALPVETGAAKFDLVLRVGETQDGLVAMLDFNTDLFKSSTAIRMLEYFQNLLRSIEAAPEAPLNTLEMFSEVETIAFQEQITIPELAQGFAF